MHQNGQTFELKSRSTDGHARWAYRYRQAGRDSKRVQRGGFASQQAAAAALERALERLRRTDGTSRVLTLEELAREYVAQHQAEPETIESSAGCSPSPSPCSGTGRSTSSRPARSPPGA